MERAADQTLLRAYGLMTRGRREEAEQGFRQVLAGDPHNVHALNLLGIVCLESARAEEAVSLIQRALSLDASDADPQDQGTADFGFAGESDHRGRGHTGQWCAWEGGGAVRGFHRRERSD